MNAEDLIYKSCYDLCIKKLCSKIVAQDAANDCVVKYKRNQFKKPHLLVKECADNAAKLAKK